VEAKHRTLAFNLNGLSYITVQGIALFAATVSSDPQSQYLVLDGLQCQYIAHVALPLDRGSYSAGYASGVLLSGTNNVLRNSTVAFSSGTGVFLEGTGQRVFNNVIRDTDYRPTYASPIFAGASQDGVSQQNQHLIAYNTIYNSGRFGIYHTQQFGTGRILHNEIYDFGLQTNDLGCTYTWMTNGMGTEIAYNLCHDGQGLLLNNPEVYVAGIYLDNGSSNFIVHHNVVWNTQWGLVMNSPSTNERLYNNTFAGSGSSFTPYGDGQLAGTAIQNNIFVGPLQATPVGAVMTNNILPGTNPQFIDPATYNFQLKPTSPAIAAGLAIPPYTNGYSGSAPDIGAYDHTKAPWKAGFQNAAYVAAPSYAPTLTPGTIAVATGSVSFDSGASVLVTDGANVDWPAPLVYVIASPPQLAFQVPLAAAPGVALITITNGDGAISLSSAPLFAGAPPISIAASQGSGQSATINTAFGTALQATVTSASGTPVPNAAVTFAVPTTGAGGTFAASATVTTNSAGVAVAPDFTANAVAGSYTITASASGVGAPAVFNLTNRVLAVSPQALSFNYTIGGTIPAAQSISVTNAASGALSWTASSNATWLLASPTSGSVPTTLSVSVNPTGLSVGSSSGVVTVSSPGIASPTITVTLTVSTAAPTGPQISASGIFNAATFLTGGIAPNEIVSITGTGLGPPTGVAGMTTLLSGSRVYIGGTAAFLIYAQDGQVNALVPFAVAGTTTTTIQAEFNEVKGNTVTIPVVSSAPGVFTQAYGPGQALMVNSDGTFNSNNNPAARNTYVAFWATGQGLVNIPQQDGTQPTGPPYPSPILPVTVTIGDVPVPASNVVFAGLVYSGEIQINVLIPDNVPTGGAVPLVVTIGGASSRPDATMAIK
jgi:uncharacterized protein (TIGR03437 family)